MGNKLYLITPPQLNVKEFAPNLEAALDVGGIGCVQLRLKSSSEWEIREACQTFKPIVQDRGIAFILNDRPDLAEKFGCDGVHIGQHDATYAEARKCVGPNSIVGVTCHNSVHLAMLAGESGADYVAFGAFYSSKTKPVREYASPNLIKKWTEIAVLPCVAIGGITPENCKPIVVAGADFIAVASTVWEHPKGPAAAIQALNSTISSIV